MNHKMKLSAGVSLIITLILFFLPSSARALSYGTVAWTYPRNVDGGPGDFQPLEGKGLLALATSSSDSVRLTVTESADAAVYGSDSSWNKNIWGTVPGLGVEPMAYAQVQTVCLSSFDGSDFPTALAYGEITILHRIREIDTAPEGSNNNIPMLLHYNLEASGNAIGTTTSASFRIQAGGFSQSLQAANGEILSGTLSFTFDSSVYSGITIGVNAGATAGYEYTANGVYVGKSAQAIADPFLFIDPNWEYAKYFVVEQESMLNPSEWVEVTRMWQNPTAVPLPSALFLFGSGLLSLVCWGRRKRE